ncbi:MAG TPA: DUF192 domain-containing protein [Fimbriimonadaceae bacterium]|nr:DUF192 domain-containing protein [Fimbriimonadaceae bacterium]
MKKALHLIPILAILVIGCQGDKSESGSGTAGTQTTGSTGAPAEHVDSLQRTYHLKDLERVTLKANGHDISAWVMDTEGKRREGMMFLTAEDVSDNDGMIFVFPDSTQRSFWMDNTILALDIIYISEHKVVLNIQEGKPFDKTSLPSIGNAMYVLEMKQGSAKRLGIKPGMQIAIPDSVKGK